MVLVTTPTALRVPGGVECVAVRALRRCSRPSPPRYAALDALIMSAAVADFRVDSEAKHKIKRGETALELHLIPNPDLLAVTAGLG